MCAFAPSIASAMALSWGCNATQPPAVTVQPGAATALVGDTITVSATATSSGANVTTFSANVPSGQGTLTGGTLLGDGSTQYAFPTGAASESGTASWVLPATPGVYTVTATAYNCNGSASASATVNVGAQAVVLPVVDTFGAASNSALAGQSVAFNASAHDPAGGTLTYSWTATGGTFTSVSTASTSWIAPAVAGPYMVTLTVSNGQGTASSAASINVVLASYQTSSDEAFRAPRRVAAGSGGEYFVVDAKSGAIVRMTATGKPAGSLRVPERMRAVTSAGSVIYAVSVTGGLYAVDPMGGAPRAIPLRDGALSLPSGITFDAGRAILWVAEAGANRVRGLKLDGTTAFVLTTAGADPLAGVDDIAFDPTSSTLWVSLDGNLNGNSLHAFDGATGKYLLSTASFGGGVGQVTRTGGLAVDASGRVFLSDMFQGTVQVFQRTGAPLGSVGQYGGVAGQLQLPAGMAATTDGAVLVANMNRGRVERFGTSGLPPPQTCTVNGQLDSDCDGMPDWWELKYGLNPYWAGDALLDSDGDGLTNLQEFKLGTNPRVANLLPGTVTAPVLTAPAPKTSDPGLVRFSVALSSPTSCTLSWKQKLGPTVTVRGADSLTPSFVGRAAGRYQLVGTASCGTQSASAVVEANIRNVAPRADGGRLVVAHAGDRISLDGRFSSDANGDAIGFAWDQTSGAPLSGAAVGSTLPLKLHQPGYATFQLSATDPAGKAGVVEAPVFAVSSAAAPTAVAVTPVVAATGAQVTLDASQSVDPAGTGTFQWVQVAGAPVTLSGAGTATPGFTAPAAGRYAFLVSLTAGNVRSPPARVEVLVGPGASLPTASVAQAALQATVGEPLSLDGGASTAANGGGLQYAWRQVSGPAAGLTDADRAVATVVPFGPGVFVFELAVTESGAPSSPARVTVTATSSVAGQGIPVAVAAAPSTAAVGTSVSLDGTQSSDPDGHWLRYRWTQVAGPWVALDDPTSSTPSFRPQLPGTYSFELQVDDQKIRSAAVSVAVTAQ